MSGFIPHTDFVFREEAGELKFVGDFEGLYKNIEDPWQQSGQDGYMGKYYVYSRANLLSATQRYGLRVMYGLEIGCGHGHVTELLESASGAEVVWEGMDVSPTAIGLARDLFPSRQFYVNDICAENRLHPAMHPSRYRQVVLGQILWYVLHRIDVVVANIHSILLDDGFLIISQSFLREQHYGKEIVDGFHGLVKLLLERYPDKFRLVEARYDDTEKYVHHDGLLVLRRV